MREGAIDAFLVDFKEPDEKVNVTAGTHREKVLPFCVLAVGVLQDDFGNFRGVDGVLQITRMDGIEAVGVQRIVKIDYIHLGLYPFVTVVVIQQLIHHAGRQVRKLVVIHEHRIPLLYHLTDERSIDAV